MLSDASGVSVLLIKFLRASPILWFLALFIFHFTVLAPEAAQAQKELETELGQISPPVQVILYESGASHKTSSVIAYHRYITALNPDEIFSYYDLELANKGWHFLSQQEVTTAAINRSYCKGIITAHLAYYGSGYDEWNYELWLWSGDECELMKGGGIIYIPLSDLWFMLGGSLSLSFYCLLIERASWVLEPEAFGQFMMELEHRFLSIELTRRYFAILLIIGMLGTLISLYKITMYLLNG